MRKEGREGERIPEERREKRASQGQGEREEWRGEGGREGGREREEGRGKGGGERTGGERISSTCFFLYPSLFQILL